MSAASVAEQLSLSSMDHLCGDVTVEVVCLSFAVGTGQQDDVRQVLHQLRAGTMPDFEDCDRSFRPASSHAAPRPATRGNVVQIYCASSASGALIYLNPIAPVSLSGLLSASPLQLLVDGIPRRPPCTSTVDARCGH